jgi:hypothetical protein
MSDRELQLHNISLVVDFMEEMYRNGQEKIIVNMLSCKIEKLQSMLDALKFYQCGDLSRLAVIRGIDHTINVEAEISDLDSIELLIQNVIYMKHTMFQA